MYLKLRRLSATFTSTGERLKPRCVIAHTIRGRGISFMENEVKWHHGIPNAAQYELALKELQA